MKQNNEYEIPNRVGGVEYFHTELVLRSEWFLQGRQVQGYRFYVMEETKSIQCGHRDRGMRAWQGRMHMKSIFCAKKKTINTFAIRPFHEC